MPIHIQQDGPITVVDVTGTLQPSDYPPFRKAFEHLVAEQTKLKVLFDMTHFDGWETGALWNELKFDAKHFSSIDRLAAIGDKRWEQGLIKLAEPFTDADMRYFEKQQSDDARRWLTQP